MKRRVAAILEFISRTQVEMASAGDTAGSTPLGGEGKGGGTEGDGRELAFVKGLMAGLGELTGGTNRVGFGNGVGAGGSGNGNGNGGSGSEEGKEFGELTSAEMMDVLTRRLVRWQQEYGKWGER